MTTVDRYVLRSFLYTWLLCLVVIMGLRVMSDLIVNIDEFAETSELWGQRVGNVLVFYAYQSLLYYKEMGGIILVFGSAFAFWRMNRSNELTALLASGISLHRVVLPVILMAILLTGLGVADQELLIPRIKHHLARRHEEQAGQEEFRVVGVPDARNRSWTSEKFHMQTLTMRYPTVWLRDSQLRALGKVDADAARYLGSGMWELREAMVALRDAHYDYRTVRVPTWMSPQRLAETTTPDPDTGRLRNRIEGEMIAVSGVATDEPNVLTDVVFDVYVPVALDSEQLADRPIVQILADRARYEQLAPPNTFGYELVNGRVLIRSDLNPEHLALRRDSHWLQFMSSGELAQLLRSGRVPDPRMASMARHMRFVDPIISLLLLLVGLPFMVSRERNVPSAALKCVLVLILSGVVVYVTRSLGGHLLDPVWAAWMPVLLLGPTAAVMLESIKT